MEPIPEPSSTTSPGTDAVEARGDELVESPVHGAQLRLALPRQPVALDLQVVLPDRQRFARVHVPSNKRNAESALDVHPGLK